MDRARDHAPDHAVPVRAQGDGWVMRVLRDQGPLVRVFFVEPFDREFAADHGDDDATRFRFQAAVDHQEVAREDTGAGHRVALDPDDEGRGGAADQVIVEIERALDEVLGGRWEAGGHRGGDQGQG